MNSPQPDAECLALIARLDSLMLATRSEQHHAEASYAPFLFDRGAFHIFVSALASHTGNLLTHRRAGVLLIEPEADAANPFARRRASFECRVAEVEADSGEYSSVLDSMQQRLGATVALLRSLPDFRLLALTPIHGRYIAGFGQAYDLDTRRFGESAD
ncbi:HugZ family protein [Methylomonas sp. MS20]|uniref:HugZ family pyridoxamine 5'-phosphate oxidase n=1 Tax=unclassified Methylomonas TaxID=2608980 RepID=UPI0028A34730|nr:pyridoxamine 5'-phosphate oxidase family protein [Methylomonas sp. MV1]MDT4331991.1 pyridoxamine 5'-phosphate oxidase family protein [Methylomonas sp. MV1]